MQRPQTLWERENALLSELTQLRSKKKQLKQKKELLEDQLKELEQVQNASSGLSLYEKT